MTHELWLIKSVQCSGADTKENRNINGIRDNEAAERDAARDWNAHDNGTRHTRAVTGKVGKTDWFGIHTKVNR